MRNHNVLVIQPRLNREMSVREQANILNITRNLEVYLTFVNPLIHDGITRWSHPGDILSTYGCSLWLGSGDIDLSESEQNKEIYLNTILPLAQKILAEDVPAMGICLGHQTFALASGAKVMKIINRSETGTGLLLLTEQGEIDRVFRTVSRPTPIVVSHKDSVVNLPSGFTILGYTMKDPNSVLRRGKIITFQGHPEITKTDELRKKMDAAQDHTINGYQQTYPFVDPGPTDVIITNFLMNIIH